MHYYDYIVKAAMDSAHYAVTTSSDRLILFWGSVILFITVVLIIGLVVQNVSANNKDISDKINKKLKFKNTATTGNLVIIGLALMFFGSFFAIGESVPLATGQVEHKQYHDELLVLQRFHINNDEERDVVKTFKLEHPNEHVTKPKLKSIKTYNGHVVLNDDTLK